MSIVEWIKTLWQYNIWAHDRVWACVEKLTESQFKQPLDYSIGSIHAQVVHVMWAEALWLNRIRGGERLDWTPESHPKREAIRAQWQATWSHWADYIQQLDEDEVQRPFTMMRGNGDQYVHTVGQVCLHVVNHSTDHRAQILAMIASLGGETVEQDMIKFFRE